MTPAVGFSRLLWAMGLGFGLGLGFDLIRPLRPRFLGDLIFLGFFGWIWLYFTFGICLGDLRMGYLFGMGLGVFLWELGPGRVVNPIFTRFWHILALPFKKFFEKIKKILKFLFATKKKSSTIE